MLNDYVGPPGLTRVAMNGPEGTAGKLPGDSSLGPLRVDVFVGGVLKGRAMGERSAFARPDGTQKMPGVVSIPSDEIAGLFSVVPSGPKFRAAPRQCVIHHRPT